MEKFRNTSTINLHQEQTWAEDENMLRIYSIGFFPSLIDTGWVKSGRKKDTEVLDTGRSTDSQNYRNSE